MIITFISFWRLAYFFSLRLNQSFKSVTLGSAGEIKLQQTSRLNIQRETTTENGRTTRFKHMEANTDILLLPPIPPTPTHSMSQSSCACRKSVKNHLALLFQLGALPPSAARSRELQPPASVRLLPLQQRPAGQLEPGGLEGNLSALLVG